MRKLGRSSDSLELLLDTVCSMFGAILLIAILVALMGQTSQVESAGAQAGVEMLRRKIATAEEDLAQARRLTADLSVPASSDAAALAAEKQDMEARLASARGQRDRMSNDVQDQVARQTVDYSSEWKKLSAEMRALQRKQEEMANSIKAQDQNTTRLNGRMADLDKRIQQEKESRVVTLRFPKERARTKRSLPIICKFGKVYPVFDADGRKNDATIAWSPKGRDAELSQPVEALGWTLSGNKSAIDHLLNKVPRAEAYLAFYVYPDSFEAFRAVRDQAAALQLEFGVSLEPAGANLIWGSEGSSPPPL